MVASIMSSFANPFWLCGRYEGLHHGSSFLEHLAFAAAVRSHGESQPSVGLDAGLLSVAVGVAAQLSMEAGRFVSLSEVLRTEGV